jgi:hypothetical protein
VTQYPQNVVWYVEARPWSGTPEAPGFAPADSTMGSAVVVQIEHLDDQNRPLQPPKIKKYLLTCAHVVRSQLGWGALYEEIFCWPQGHGYSRTYPNRRPSGEHPGAYRARVSPLSPCSGIKGAVPAGDQIAPNDWLLLDLEAADFQAMPAVREWGVIKTGVEIKIVGFPGGAGLSSQQMTGHFWNTGNLVESVAPNSFRQTRVPAAGMVILDGDDTRPGMSGGGVFDTAGIFVGIHRSTTDQTMAKGAVSAGHIRDWLGARHLRPVSLPAVAPPPAPPAGLPASPRQGVIDDFALGQIPKIPFINRRRLRANLQYLTGTGSGYKLLSMTGAKGSGKSYSWHLIKYVAESFSIIPVRLDISQNQSLEDACETIADQMCLDIADMKANVLADAPAPERIGRKFAQWLGRTTNRRKPQKWWLVFDGLDENDKPFAQLRDNLFQSLVNGIQSNNNFTQVVLIAIGTAVNSDPLFQPYTLTELVDVLTKIDVQSFVVEYAAQLGKTLTADESSAINRQILNSAEEPFSPEQMEQIRLQSANVIERVLV